MKKKVAKKTAMAPRPPRVPKAPPKKVKKPVSVKKKSKTVMC